jgi:hypothetical protein
MTTPEQKGPPPFDPAHPSIQGTQAWLNVGRQRTPAGEVLIVTVRVTNATLTVVLDKTSAQSWLKTISDEIDKMSSLMVAPPGVQLPPMNGHPPGQ